MDNIISSEYMLLNGYMSFLVVSSFTFKNLHVRFAVYMAFSSE